MTHRISAALRRLRPSPAFLGITGATLAVAAVVVLVHIRAYTVLSGIDELQHVDYLDQASRFDLVREGERVGEVAMREQACRGINLPDFSTPPCDTPTLDPADFQEKGFNTAAQHPPTYYTLTGLTARGLLALPQVDSLVTAGRSVGVVWLGIGLLLTYMLSRRLGARPAAAGGAVLLLACTPAVIQASALVTNDAPSLLVGALVVLVALRDAERQLSPWWLAGAAALATSMKITNLLAVGVAVLVVLLAAHRRAGEPAPMDGPRSSQLRRYRSGIALVLGGALPPLIWMAVAALVATPEATQNPMRTNFLVPSIGAGEVLDNLMAVATPVLEPNVWGGIYLDTSLVVLLITVLNVLLLGALTGAAWFDTSHRRVNDLALATLAAMLLGGPFFVALVFLTTHNYFPIPARYGLSLLPAAGAVLAYVASLRRWGPVTLLGLGVVSLGGVVAALV